MASFSCTDFFTCGNKEQKSRIYKYLPTFLMYAFFLRYVLKLALMALMEEIMLD
jgi:hypothetical protein